jgi:hypothetical protein
MHRDHGRARLFHRELPDKSWESKIGTFLNLAYLDNSRPYPVADLSLNCSKASADGGDLPFYVKALVDCVEELVQVDRVAVCSS